MMKCVTLQIPKVCIPEGAELMECYKTANEIVVCGCPDPDDESHDCDEMGCGSMSHVLYRFAI